ncbi:unnamed protein product [Sphagnum jensenii]|uniref:Uncharacterized protein n=1 Tax=Sphagnum jensenii TaxID=128206 RepID=A0ABP1ACY3_9BRYO
MEESSAISLAPFDVLCRKDSAVYKNLTTVDLEVLLTQTILQTSSPQNLSPWTEEGFSVAVLISWLLDARDSLCGLTYGLQWFQVLWLTCESVGDIWKFEACPTAAARERSINGRGFRRSKLAFALVSVFVSGREFTTVDNVSLEAEVLASLELDRCTLQHFGLVSKGKLRKLTIKRARIPELDIRPETSMLQALHVSSSTIPWPGFGQLTSKVPNLKVLQLRGLESRAYSDVMNVEKIAELIPRLNDLAMALDDQLMRGSVDQLLL